MFNLPHDIVFYHVRRVAKLLDRHLEATLVDEKHAVIANFVLLHNILLRRSVGNFYRSEDPLRNLFELPLRP